MPLDLVVGAVAIGVAVWYLEKITRKLTEIGNQLDYLAKQAKPPNLGPHFSDGE